MVVRFTLQGSKVTSWTTSCLLSFSDFTTPKPRPLVSAAACESGSRSAAERGSSATGREAESEPPDKGSAGGAEETDSTNRFPSFPPFVCLTLDASTFWWEGRRERRKGGRGGGGRDGREGKTEEQKEFGGWSIPRHSHGAYSH